MTLWPAGPSRYYRERDRQMEASSAPQDVGLVEASSDQLLPRGRNKRMRCDHSAHARANTVHCVAGRVVAARSFIEAR